MTSSIKPLADRVRPQTLEQCIGQEHLTGDGAVISETLRNGNVPSMIFWGPPGVGKTTIARIIGHSLNLPFYQLSAISAGVADVRKVIEDSKKLGRVMLFLDEIHRFNKSQQDALLGAVESGHILLIGATTENPGFEVNNALLSRCQVYVLKELDANALQRIAMDALKRDEIMCTKNIELKETDALFLFSGGDARKMLNILELVVNQLPEPVMVTNAEVTRLLQQRTALYDKGGEEHYNIISAFIKSIRGSDPNAAVYWLARMLDGGEQIEFIARRMIILASEDIGNANPNALLLATQTFQAIHTIGMPESRIILAQCATYLASSPKSNASYMAIESAFDAIQKHGPLPVPLHLRNAPNQLMKSLHYGETYAYAHAHPGNFVEQEFLPDKLSNTTFYVPGANSRENEIRAYLKNRWKEKYGY